MDQEEDFSGFMPMVEQVKLSKETTMLGSQGELVKAHGMTVITKDGSEYIFSIDSSDLMRLFFLSMRVLGD
jgi:hypothetical protein